MSQPCQLQLTADIALVVVPVHSGKGIQQILVAIQQWLKVLRICHQTADLVLLRLIAHKGLTEVAPHRHIPFLIGAVELVHIAHAPVLVTDDLAVIHEFIGVEDDLNQGGFAGAVAADKGAVLSVFQSEGDIVIQLHIGEAKRKIFNFYITLEDI